MVIGGHMVCISKQVVGKAVITGINNQKNVVTTDRLFHQTLSVTALETGAVTGYNKGILVHANFLTPVDQMLVNQLGKFFRAGAGNQSKGCFLSIRVEKFCGCYQILRHDSISPPSL